MNARAVIEVFRDTFKGWTDDRATRLGAALAYYTLFSIAPLLLIAVAIAGLAFGEAAARGQIVEVIQGAIGRDAAVVVQELVKNMRASGSGVVATVVGIVVLIFGASGVFAFLKDALNTIWNVRPRPSLGLRGVIRDRLLAIAMVLGIGMLLIALLAANTVVAVLSHYFAEALPNGVFVLRILNAVISFGLVTVLFAVIYRVLPDVDIVWRDVWIGAAFTSLLFTIGIFLLSLYLSRSSIASAYGAAGSLVVILVWVYYSAQIFFFGAEFTQVYANKFGSRIEPSEHAVRVVKAIDGPLADSGSEPNARPEAPPADTQTVDESSSAASSDTTRRERFTFAAIGAGLVVIVGALVSLLGPLIGIRGRSKKRDS